MARQNNQPKVSVFRLILADGESHRHLWDIKFSRVGFFISAITAIVVLLVVTFLLITLTPLKTFIPGYPDGQTKREAVQNAITIDSLQSVIVRWELYSENLLRVVEGDAPLKIDSLTSLADERQTASRDAGYLQSRDSLLRSVVNDNEQFEISDGQERQLPIEGMHFFVPLRGAVSQGYDAVLHPYIDITAPANSVVMAALDGTVIFAGWNDDSGYVIQLQHENDIVTTYKHNQKLLKKTGDKVSAGSPISLVGNTGNLTTGDHLHFELWYKGEAVDPTKYINF